MQDWISDDFTFCSKGWKECGRKNCERHPKQIHHPELPHSYSDFSGSDYCPIQREKKMRKWSSNEITKMIDAMIGSTEPVADSAIDATVNDNLMTMIDVINWCMDGVYDAARCRKSPYGSQRDVGERAYAAMLEWKEWISNIEEELA